MTIPDEYREFLENHRLCIVGVDQPSGPPALSPVYYVLDSDDIVISTTSSRAKAKAVRRNPEVTLCVLGEGSPFPYLTVFGRGTVTTEDAVDVMARIGEVMFGRPVPDEMRPELEKRADEEGRVVLRVTPERYFTTRLEG